MKDMRVVIESVEPEVDGGRFPIKRTVGEEVVVQADIFADGHDVLSATLLYRYDLQSEWTEIPLEPLVNDRWQRSFIVTELGTYRYTLKAWVDEFKTWQQNLLKKLEAEQDVSVELLVGAEMVGSAAREASGRDAAALRKASEALRSNPGKSSAILGMVEDESLASLMSRYAERRTSVAYSQELGVVVERERARFSTWYEMFPRSTSQETGGHGTFQDCEARLPYVASMGFDVLYLPPIHPIGHTYRKGRNNSTRAKPGDPGTPWAVGSEEGGHKTIHPALGTLEEFRHLVVAAQEHGMEIALDIAFQCSPDHPYVKEHPEWFRKRPDGTVQYAENPPKKYQDIYPLNFDSAAHQELWEELKSVVLFWIDQGVRIFRVDNPHTKPFAFWEWLIAEVKAEHPDVIFLAEAFTRPKVMYRLAKLGFTQSYNYFAWRNTKWELTQYLTELTQTQVKEFFRPNLWPNTPDILTEYLQTGGRPAFMTRLVLAATLGASYGIYGPAFELCVDEPREPGSEEYLGSEKYEVKHWDIRSPQSLREFIARVNRIRKENPALQSNDSLYFHTVSNEQIICYSKHTSDFSNVIIVVINLDPHHVHSDWIELDLAHLGIDPTENFQMHDLLSDARYQSQGSRNYVELNPGVVPAHIFQVRHRVRSERDFDYFA